MERATKLTGTENDYSLRNENGTEVFRAAPGAETKRGRFSRGHVGVGRSGFDKVMTSYGSKKTAKRHPSDTRAIVLEVQLLEAQGMVPRVYVVEGVSPRDGRRIQKTHVIVDQVADGNLQERLAEMHRAGPRERLGLAAACAKAVADFHQIRIAGVPYAHLDIWTENLLCFGKKLKLMDPGCAFPLGVPFQGSVRLPLSRMSPQTARAMLAQEPGMPGRRDDLFQLGLVLLHVLTGRSSGVEDVVRSAELEYPEMAVANRISEAIEEIDGTYGRPVAEAVFRILVLGTKAGVLSRAVPKAHVIVTYWEVVQDSPSCAGDVYTALRNGWRRLSEVAEVPVRTTSV